MEFLLLIEVSMCIVQLFIDTCTIIQFITKPCRFVTADVENPEDAPLVIW